MLDVLYEDNHLLAVNKPAMLPTMGVANDRRSLLEDAKQYLRKKYNKPGNVYLGIVSRLDAPVTGVVLMARTSKAAARLNRQFHARDVEKTYWAIVEGDIEPPAGRVVDFLRKDERHRLMHVTNEGASGAQHAELHYRRLDDKARDLSWRGARNLAWVEVQLVTGRKHQIRVQLAHAGFPILGDRKYGSRLAFSSGIALHSRRLAIEHPVTKIQIEIEAPLPSSWQPYLAAE